MSDLTQSHAQPDVSVDLSTLTDPKSRRVFLGTMLAGAAALTAVAPSATSVFAAGSKMKYAAAAFPKGDADILNYALTLEHLETAFYTEAAMKMGHSGYVAKLVKIIQADEQQHVSGLTAALRQGGYTPVGAAKKYHLPAVFGNKQSFLKFAAVLESTGVHAYLGQAGLIKTPSILLTAASIVTVEARHTGAINALLGQNPTEGAFDQGYNKQKVLSIAGPLIGH
jgi:rubrerythrin